MGTTSRMLGKGPWRGVSAALLAVGAAGFTGCSDGSDECGDEVYARADPDVDFAEYTTFRVAEVADLIGGGGAGGATAEIPDDVQADIATANDEAERQLELLGLVQAPSDEEPDLWIASAGATSDQSGIYWECVPGWYWWGWNAVWDACAWVEPIPVEYSVGTLVVALVDASSNEVVFGGFGQGVLECSENKDARIEDIVDQIFDSYPVQGD